MKKKLYMIVGALVACAAICLSGCGSDKGAEKDTTVATTTASVVESTEEKTEEPTTEDTKVVYSVKVVDEEGNIMPSVMVQICKDACIPGKTNDQGVAEFNVEEDSEYKASVLQMPEGYELAGDEENFYFESGSKELTITLKKSN